MAFRTVFSNVRAVTWKAIDILGVEDVSLDQAFQRVSGSADNELHETIQFAGQMSTSVSLTLQSPPSAALVCDNNLEAAMGSLVFTIKARMADTGDKTYTVENVRWFDIRHNGAFGQMRRWTLSGNAIHDGGTDPTTVS